MSDDDDFMQDSDQEEYEWFLPMSPSIVTL